ncbi:rsbT co-antagonist protein RsbR [Fictibacillus enclensis]|nr:rsbT co-antagonist protein RsbR [Fictibacillus enclensis]
MENLMINLMEKHHDEMFENWVEELARAIQQEEKLTPNYAAPITKELFDITFNSLINMDMENRADLRQFYLKILLYNGSPNFITQSIQAFRRVVLKTLIQEDLTKEQVLLVYNRIDRWFDPVITHVVNDCTHTWESTFSQQQEALKEMTAPFIQLFDGLAVMPLVGNISEDRAEIIMNNLLQGINEYKTKTVFLDITGVPIVDTFIAQSIIKAIQAAKLLGAECIIVGTRPETAQTIVHLGIDLSEINKFSSLGKGLIYAIKKLNLSFD